MAQEDKFIVPHRRPAVGKSTVVSVRLPDQCSPNWRMWPPKQAVPATNWCRCASTTPWPGWRSPKNDKSSLPARRLLSVFAGCFRTFNQEQKRASEQCGVIYGSIALCASAWQGFYFCQSHCRRCFAQPNRRIPLCKHLHFKKERHSLHLNIFQ